MQHQIHIKSSRLRNRDENNISVKFWVELELRILNEIVRPLVVGGPKGDKKVVFSSAGFVQ